MFTRCLLPGNVQQSVLYFAANMLACMLDSMKQKTYFAKFDTKVAVISSDNLLQAEKLW
jgi:hypothetical protein